MPHYTTGLPKLDLEPFDATELYAAANASGAGTEDDRTRRLPRGLWVAVVAGVLAAVAVVALVVALA